MKVFENFHILFNESTRLKALALFLFIRAQFIRTSVFKDMLSLSVAQAQTLFNWSLKKLYFPSTVNDLLYSRHFSLDHKLNVSTFNFQPTPSYHIRRTNCLKYDLTETRLNFIFNLLDNFNIVSSYM